MYFAFDIMQENGHETRKRKVFRKTFLLYMNQISNIRATNTWLHGIVLAYCEKQDYYKLGFPYVV